LSSRSPFEPAPEYFNEFLARARVERDVTYNDLAGAAGVSASMIRAYVMGRNLPRVGRSGRQVPRDKLARFAAALGYPVEYVTACWQASMDGTPQVRLTVCQRGHDIPPDAGEGRCPDCTADCRDRATAAQRERNFRLACSACGRRSVFEAGFCSPCYHSSVRYGDPSITRAPRNGEGRSGFRGVQYKADLIACPWNARISHDKQLHNLGWFPTAEAAARAYDAKALELLGGKARLNFPAHSDGPGRLGGLRAKESPEREVTCARN
jgi:transcriptional regulator with XRE-family HTH domain